MVLNNLIKEGMTHNEIDEFVNLALKKMTLKEKIYIMSGNGLVKYILKDRGFAKRAYPSGGNKRLGIPPFFFTDGPRGVIITGSTCFPVSMARGASWDRNLEERIGDVIGKELRAHGGTLFGGVCINLLYHPAGGRAQETYGEDPYHVGELGAALVRGVQKHNVMATIKHYLANNFENDRFKINVKMDERTLREVYLPHYKRCIEEGCATVMSAYNKVRGEYCGHNSYLLRTILKEEWGFEGFVHSDWMMGLRDTVKGINGGLDVEMPRAKFYGNKLIRAVEKGEVPLDLIDDSVSRIIKTVLKFCTRKDPLVYNKNLIACEDHILLAREAAEKSMVLLKNENNLLPLNSEASKNIAVIGRLAVLKNTGDHGSSSVRQKNIITALDGLKSQVGNEVNFIYNDDSEVDSAKNIAISTDAAILIVGYTHKDEGEFIPQLRVGGDRTSLELHPEDNELINAISSVNSNTIVVLVGASAIIMEEWKEKVPAIIMAWYSGMEGGIALANILFGKINPSGKLPFVIPKKESDLPFYQRDIEELEYSYYHGYTLMDKEKKQPAFHFGFGLSYTLYHYENLQVKLVNDTIIGSVDVSNIGSVKGEEIVQLYIGLENSKIERPIKVLKGFTKIALETNEKKNVSIEVNKKDLYWYNPETNTWELEEMKYTVYMGASSKMEDLLSSEIKLS